MGAENYARHRESLTQNQTIRFEFGHDPLVY